MAMSNQTAKQIAAWGFLGCTLLGVVPVGCGSSLESAPMRYRAAHDGPRLPDITVERLQHCFEEYGHEFEDSSIRVDTKIQVDSEGRKLGMDTTGLPDRAPDFSACTRSALQDMTIPAWPLRAEPTAHATNGPAKPMGNEMANPVVVVEVLVELGEFVAENEGRAALYAVTLEVLSTVAVAATKEYLRRRRNKDACREHLTNCLMTSTNDERGNHWNERRCRACFLRCKDGVWPASIDFITGPESCAY